MPDLPFEQTAQYIRFLLDKCQDLDSRLKKFEREDQGKGVPAVPFAGIFPALIPKAHEVVLVTEIDEELKTWKGKITTPVKTSPFWSRSDNDPRYLIEGVVPDGHSVPMKDDIVEASFTGMYMDDPLDDNSPLSPRYGKFHATEPRAGLTAAVQFAYPTEPDANVYEVMTKKGTFQAVPGKQDLTGDDWGVVIAMNLTSNPRLIPEGTKVLVHRHNNRWWFTESGASSPTSPSSGQCQVDVTVTVTVTHYSYCYAYCGCNTCATPTRSSSCTSWWDSFTQTYITSCSSVATCYNYISSCTSWWDSYTQTYITSCTTYLSSYGYGHCTCVGSTYVAASYTYQFAGNCGR